MLEKTDKDYHIALQMIEAAKNHSKSHYDSHIYPCIFNKGYLILIYDKYNDNSGKQNLESMWYIP